MIDNDCVHLFKRENEHQIRTSDALIVPLTKVIELPLLIVIITFTYSLTENVQWSNLEKFWLKNDFLRL